MNNKSYNKNLEYFDIDLRFRQWNDMSTVNDLEWEYDLNGDVILSNDVSHISSNIGFNQSLRNIILTNIYERPFDEKFGGNLYYSLFENYEDFIMNNYIKETLVDLINKYEPRIDLLDVMIFEPENKYAYKSMSQNIINITVKYTIPTSDGTFTVSFPIERIR